MSSIQQPPTKKRKLNEMLESKVDEDGDDLLDIILKHDINEFFGDKTISDEKLQQFATKLNALQKQISVRLSNSNTLSLTDRLKKSIDCTHAYVGDGDGNIDYESWHCQSNGTFLIGPNKKEIKFNFNGAQENGGSMYEGWISFDDVWVIQDIEDGVPLQLYYSRKKTKELIEKSGYDLQDNDKAIDDFAEILTIICLEKFTEKANQHWSGSIDVDFDFEELWEKREDFDS